jgi:hypothetical protein
MKAKLCIIGVEDSVNLIKKISNDFIEKASFSFYIYEELEEIDNYLLENQKNFDAIIFTGSYPMRYVEKKDIIRIPYLKVIKSSITVVETLWKMRDDNVDFKKISIDRSPKKEIIETLEHLNISLENIHLIPDSSKISLENIYEEHLKLYEEGKTSGMIVSNHVVYEKLKEKNLPAYRILPSRFLIKETIKKAIALVNTEKIKDKQIAIQTIKIKNINNEISLDYNCLEMINKFDKILIAYTKKIHGSFFKFGNTDYIIFTTRGLLNKGVIEKQFGMLVESSNKYNISFSSGVGYGSTIYQSEKNSRIALSHAVKEEKKSCYIVEDDLSILGPIYGIDSHSLSYNLESTDEETLNISKKTNVSNKYILKIKAIISDLNKNTFDAEELSNYLSISKRSTSRIINKLESGGFAENIGKKNDSTVGRPKNIYKITF